MTNYKVNLWSDYIDNRTDETLEIIFEAIRQEEFYEVEEIRQLLKKGKKKEADKLKNELPSFTTSGFFDKKRKKENLIKYYGLMVLDIDKLESEEEVEQIKEKAKSIPETKMAFVSPSGLGLKIIVETNNTDVERHTEVYKELVEYYEKALEVKLDSQTCDVARLCFISSDVNAYYNEDSKIFQSEVLKNTPKKEIRKEIKIKKEVKIQIINDLEKYNRVIEEVVYFTGKRQKYESGNRNRFVYLLVKNAKLGGVSDDIILEYCLNHYVEDDFTDKEIEDIIKSVYNDEKIEFGKFANKYKKFLKQRIF